MRPEPEEIDLATFRRLTARLPRQKRAKRTGALAIPRAAPVERDGLSTMIKRGWSIATEGGERGVRLYRINGPTTDVYPTIGEAVKEAKQIDAEHGDV
jgi:hypothetical protein